MTEQNVEERQEQNTPAQGSVSETSLSQEASKSETDLRAELEGLKNELRGLQGKMDKDAHRIESNLDKRLEQLGITLTPEQKMQNRIIDLEERLSVEKTQASVKPQADQEPQKPVDIAKIKAAYNDIDFNQPQVLAAVSQNLNNEDGLLAALGKLKVAGLDKPKPTGASAVSPSGNVSTSGRMEDLQAAYDKLLEKPFDPEAKKQRDEIIRQMNELEQA